MFYSHEVLTSRKHGVATVWLVATLGSRSSLKKVNRKAILDVNVPKACETILMPEAPMALRLQSNLLYGVTRVYLQQCTYILADCQNAHNSIRATLNVVKAAVLDPEAGRARPEQLLLQDDPSFLPEFAFEPLDLDLDVSTTNASLSPRSSRRSRSINLEERIGGPVGGINLSTSDTAAGDFGGFTVPGDDGIGSGGAGRSSHPEDDGFDPNADFAFDADGNLIEREIQDEAQKSPSRGPASEATRSDHEIAQQRATFNAMRVAPQRQRKSRVIPFDTTMELRNSDLMAWQRDYLQNMVQAAQHKFNLRVAAQAKKNAEYWVLGRGLGGIGAISGLTGIPGPLDMFKGEELLRSLGINREPAPQKKRRHRESTGGDEPEDRRVRQRSDEDELGRGMEDDAVVYHGDEDVEMGREAAEEIQSQLSQHFPWSANASARASSVAASARNALGFGGHGFPSSVGGPSSIGIAGSLGHRTSRMVSASPLHGRGASHGQAIAGQEMEPEEVFDDTLGAFNSDAAIGDDEFELYGAAAGVDTQTANQSQFANAQFDHQMVQFGEFIFETMQKKKANEDEDEEGQVDQNDEVLFEELIDPDKNTKIVAAQGFMHLLGLATQGRVAVRQDEPYSDIGISLPLVGSL
ncbi:Rad21/Rec8 N terminal domain-containing protein [Phyllosticta capitalensis]|uniref:Rad21/Rec8 N terminal domain-containing protein n=1 Tax=Phyllosticta capitalensis TaxID=121624 RepID=A0ABR1YVI0_9PEZI